MVKPLAEVGQAKARIVELEMGKAPQGTTVKLLEAELDATTALEKLAKRLHARGKLEIAVDE